MSYDPATAGGCQSYAYMSGNENPRLRKRTVLMEVFSCGFSRTGTTSMQAALEILGIPTWHHANMMANPPDMDMWSEALLNKFDPEKAASLGIKPYSRKEFDNMLGYWGGTTDQPAAILCEELINAYPEAKVVLVERDVEKWFKSYVDGPITGTFNPTIPPASYIDPFFMARICYQTDLIIKYYFGVSEPRQKGIFNNKEARRMYIENSRKTYIAHNEMVKRVTPKDRLLLFKLEDGWEPLCEFLGKDIPDVPFPKLNETEVLLAKTRLYVRNSYKHALVRLAKRAIPMMTVMLAAVVWLMRRTS